MVLDRAIELVSILNGIAQIEIENWENVTLAPTCNLVVRREILANSTDADTPISSNLKALAFERPEKKDSPIDDDAERR